MADIVTLILTCLRRNNSFSCHCMTRKKRTKFKRFSYCQKHHEHSTAAFFPLNFFWLYSIFWFFIYLWSEYYKKKSLLVPKITHWRISDLTSFKFGTEVSGPCRAGGRYWRFDSRVINGKLQVLATFRCQRIFYNLGCSRRSHAMNKNRYHICIWTDNNNNLYSHCSDAKER